MNPIKYSKMCISNFLSRNQNPLQKLEGASRELEDMLKEMKLGLVDMVSARNITKNQVTTIETEISGLTTEITGTMKDGDEVVKPLIRQKIHLEKMKEKYETQLENLKPKIDSMAQSVKQLEAEVKCFKLDAKLMKSDYNTAKSINKINLSTSGLSGGPDMSVVDEIRERVEEFNAQSDAINELTDMGVIKNESILNHKVDESEVDAELERLKGE